MNNRNKRLAIHKKTCDPHLGQHLQTYFRIQEIFAKIVNGNKSLPALVAKSSTPDV